MVHPYSAQAWTTLATGVNAGRHGIFDFWERDPSCYGFRLTNASQRAWPAIWEFLSRQGQDVIVMNVPMTFPPDRVRGTMISGRDTPGMGNTFTHPASLMDSLSEMAGEPYVIVPDDWLWMERGRPDHAREELMREIRVRFRVLRRLLHTQDWRFAMVVTSAMDGAAHFFWRFLDPQHPLYTPESAKAFGDTMLKVYQRVDQELGELLEALPRHTGVLVVSDHGQGAQTDRAFHLNLWLAQHGFLTFEKGLKASLRQLTRQGMDTLKKLVYRSVSFQTLSRLRRMWPDRIRARTLGLAFQSGIDFAKTRAFSEEWRGNIWLNVQGRDPLGIVSPGNTYDALREEIAAHLLATADPETGEPLIHQVWKREDLFSGPYTDLIPDLLIETEAPSIFRRTLPGASQAVRVVDAGEMSTFKTNGDHRYDGVLMAWGPGILPKSTFSGASLLDIVPTALYWLGEPIPSDLDGRLLAECFKPDVVTSRPPIEGEPMGADRAGIEQVYTPSDETAVEKRLKGLGYLE